MVGANVDAIALQRDISFRKLLVKNGFRETGDGSSSIKGFHVYRRSPDIGEKLKYVPEETNRHSNTAIKVVGDTNELHGFINGGAYRCSIKIGVLRKTKLQAYNFIKKEALAQVFFCEFCEVFKNTFFTEHLWTTASVFHSYYTPKFILWYGFT